MPDREQDERLRLLLDQTRFPSPETFTWASIAGLFVALLLLVIGYNSSNAVFVLLAIAALLIGAISMSEGRIWSAMARRHFVRSATRAGIPAECAHQFWDALGDEDGES